jgi:hypothetical protein
MFEIKEFRKVVLCSEALGFPWTNRDYPTRAAEI